MRDRFPSLTESWVVASSGTHLLKLLLVAVVSARCDFHWSSLVLVGCWQGTVLRSGVRHARASGLWK